jgi:two-component system invasion response regulator UvrY
MIVLVNPTTRDTPGGESVTVVVADDNSLFRRAAGDVVAAAPGFRLLAEADCGEDAVRLAATLRPHLVLMDMRMPGLSGAAAARRIAAVRPGTVVVLLSADKDSESTDVPASDVAAMMEKRQLSPRMLAAVWATYGALPPARVRQPPAAAP